MRRFRPFPDKPYWSMTYYEVPADTLEDADECMTWARKSLSAAVTKQRAASKRRAPKAAAPKPAAAQRAARAKPARRRAKKRRH
jgi:hypothetical protein